MRLLCVLHISARVRFAHTPAGPGFACIPQKCGSVTQMRQLHHILHHIDNSVTSHLLAGLELADVEQQVVGVDAEVTEAERVQVGRDLVVRLVPEMKATLKIETSIIGTVTSYLRM